MVPVQSFISVPTFGGSAAKVSPASIYSTGYVPGVVLPAQNVNYFLNGLTGNGNTAQTALNNVIAELVSILTEAGILPNSGQTTQVLQSLQDLFLGIGDQAFDSARLGGDLAALFAKLANPNFSGTMSADVVNISGVLTWLSTASGRFNNGFLHGDSVTQNTVFDGLAILLDTVGKETNLCGALYDVSSNLGFITSKAVRTSSTQITVYGFRTADNASQNIVVTNGSSNIMKLSISW